MTTSWLKFIFACCASVVTISAQATTISVIDAPGATVYSAAGPTCAGSPKGTVISVGCYGGPGDFLSPQGTDRYAFLRADISGLEGLNFDHVYLSLTEIRTGDFFKGTANLFAAHGNVDHPFSYGPQTRDYLAGADRALAAGMTALGSITGTGVGGNNLLFDVTDAVLRSMQNGVGAMGFLLTGTGAQNSALGILGSNYYSGLPACIGTAQERQQGQFETCQYNATSYYEYPTLIATKGKQITAFDKLPERPVPPLPLPPAEVPEPGTILLMLVGWLMIMRTK